jgi:group I intron endonuclease
MPFQIYMVSGPEGKLYIGQTKRTLRDRWNSHKWNAKNKKCNWYFYNAVRKHGDDKFRIFWLATVETQQEASKTEDLYIRVFNTMDPEFGYNTKSGGVESYFTPEVREKMSQKVIERWRDPENKKKWSESRSGEKGSFYGKKHSPETREKIKQGHVTRDPETYVKNHGLSTDEIVRLVDAGQTYTDIARHFGVSSTAIRYRYKNYCNSQGIVVPWKGQKYVGEERQALKRQIFESYPQLSYAKIGKNIGVPERTVYTLYHEYLQENAH